MRDLKPEHFKTSNLRPIRDSGKATVDALTILASMPPAMPRRWDGLRYVRDETQKED